MRVCQSLPRIPLKAVLIYFTASFERIFKPVKASSYTYVFNCGGETRYSQEDSVYNVRSVALSTALARECARRRIPAYIEFSTGMVYKSPSSSVVSSGGCSEMAPLKPWLKLAKYKLVAEEGLETIRAEFESKPDDGQLRYAILRLAHVYGDYDVGFLARGLCLARVYQSKNEDMKWLYRGGLRINTVHVHDVCSAAWEAAKWAEQTPPESPELSANAGGRVFNIVDNGDTSQQDMAQVIGAIFKIQTGFQNALINTFAKFNLDSVVDDVNEDVLQPWADLLAQKGVTRAGPIGPFMEKELLKDSDLCLNGNRARRVLGWAPGAAREKMNEETVRSVVSSYERMGWWP